MIKFLATFMLFSLAAPAYAAPPAACSNTAPGRCYSPCDQTWIAEISPEGDVITLSTGYAYDVDPHDRKTVINWLEGGPDVGDNVLICDTGRLVNKDRPDGEIANVRLHPGPPRF
jgi:hypothetical protein